MKDFPESGDAKAQERKAFVRDWIARNQRKLSGGLASGMLVLPLMAQAQTDGFVNIQDFRGIQSIQQMPDGALRVILQGGQQVMIQAADVTVTADGEILISQAAADMLASLLEVAPGAGLGGAEVIAAGAAAGLLAAAAGGGGSAAEPPLPTLNLSQVLSQSFEQLFGDPPPAGATRVFVTLGEGDDAVEVEATQDVDGNWTVGFDPDDLGALQGEQVLSFRAEREELDEDDDPTGEFEQIGSGSATFIIDTIPPEIDITSIAGGDSVLNDAEQEAGLVVEGSTDADDGQVVTVEVLEGTTVIATGTGIVSGETWTATVTVAGLLDDGASYDVRATVEDAAGNAAEAAVDSFTTDFTATIEIDDFGPLDTAASFFDLDVTGTTGGVQEGQPVSFTFGGVSYPGITVGADGTWSVTIPQEDLAALRDAGVTEVTATASVTDQAGNTGVAEPVSVTPDFEAPSLTITTPDADAVLNEDTAQDGLTVAGETVAGAEVTVSINGTTFAPVTADSDGAWTLFITEGELPDDGDYTITASARLNGIEVAPDATVGLTIDTVAPEVIITDLGFAGDTLNEAERADGFTITGTVSDAGTDDLNDIDITLELTFMEDGESVTVPIPVTISTDGTDTATWEAVVPLDVRDRLPSGEQVDVAVTATDPAENTSDPVEADFNTDFIAEIFVDADLEITTLNTFIGFEVTGTTNGIDDGQPVFGTLNGISFTGEVDGATNTWSAFIEAADIAALDDGATLDIFVSVTDLAGNSDSATGSATVDFSQPALAITSPADEGFLNADFFTAGENLEVEGVAPPGEEVTVTIDGGSPQTVTAGSDGSWSVEFDFDDIPTAEAPFDIVAVSEIEGVEVPFSITLTVDTTPPVAPDISFNDTGEVAGLTNDGEITVTGLEPGGRAEYSLDDGDTWVPFTGDSFTLEGDGPYTVIVRQFDAAGNESDPSNELVFTLDTEAPATPTITLAEDTGEVAGQTQNGEVEVGGLEDDSIREYSLDGGPWIEFTGDSFTLTDEGAYAVIVRQTDGAGNESPPSATLEFTVDNTPPAAPTIALAEDTGTEGNNITANGQVNVDGLEDGSIREYSLNGGPWIEFTGNSFTLEDEDDYSVIVRQTDGAGNISDQSAPLDFTLDTTPPNVIITSLAGIEAGDSFTAAELFDGDGEQLPNVTLTGTADGAPDGATVSLVLGGDTGLTLIPQPTVTGGAWTATVSTTALINRFGTDGLADIEARITDGAGNTGTGTFAFTMDVVIPTITVEQPTDGFVGGLDAFENGFTISGTTTDVPEGAEVTITIMDGPDDTEGFEGTAEVGADGSWSIFIEPQGVQGAADETAFTLTASVSDGIFPVAVSDSIGISTDIPPQVTINVGEDGALIIADVAENGFTISGTTRGVQEGQRVILQIDEGDGDGPTDIFEEFEDNPEVDENGNWSVFIDDPDLDGVEPGMEFIFSANVANASGREADTASTTVAAYAASSLLAVETARDGDDVTISIFGLAEAFPDGIEALAVTIFRDMDVVEYIVPGAPDTFAQNPHPDFFSAVGNPDDSAVSGPGSATIAAGTLTPFDDFSIPLVEFGVSLIDGDAVIDLRLLDTTPAIDVPFQVLLGTDGADTLIAANTDSVIRGRGGDDQIDVSAPGVNTIIFEPTLALNGEDEITGFTIGGALADRIGIAFNDDFTQSDLRGTGEFFQIVEAGESIGANVGFVVFSTNFTDATPALEDLAISGLGLGANERVFVLAGEEEGSSLALLFTDGDGNAEFEDLAVFEDLSFAELAGFSSANILGFEQFTT